MRNAAIKERGLEPEDLAEGSASRMVAAYLRTMEARDLDGARAMLAPGFTMTFPGNRQYTQLEELIEGSKGRYRNVRKVFERFDEAETPDGTIVYSIGTLTGEWPDGTAFSGIRYIDRFLVRDGKFIATWVWNDMAEVRRGD
ncbi:MAG: nuclear transport factor 2 family protein [Proteobacteria bacterium]|nr:nuclear transport factor 2 family protein [Pseudomonadota bacterium]